MEPTITLSKKGIPTSRPLYKEYKNLQFDIIQSPQQINRWNRLKQHVIKSERRVHYNKPYLLNKQIEQSFSTIAENLPPNDKDKNLFFISDNHLQLVNNENIFFHCRTPSPEHHDDDKGRL
ncbi:unnamed protein product [Rhizophagus irregularis]|uniref:Uncharacterized protein n=1 Tax=Rhizophagus irregularis TaxID=588596 RepID=A0A915YWE9_9GLOM|nr:unnamed protein product [Rhizophagus irregularis]